MECPWRRTLASVLLLLSPNVSMLNHVTHSRIEINYHLCNTCFIVLQSFVCQNAVPTGPLPPLLKEPFREASMKPGLVSQQINLVPLNGFSSEFVPRSQCLPEYQRIPEYIGPAYPPACVSVPQTNIGSCFQGVPCGVSQSCLPQSQGAVCNALPNTITQTPQALPLNIISTPQVANKLVNTSPIQEISSNSLLPSGPQYPNFDIPPKISPVPIVPNIQNQKGFKRSFVPTIASAVNVPLPARISNQNKLTIPSMSNPCPQSFAQPPASDLCKVTSDLTLLNYLPTPNLPISVPAPNCAPITQVPVQPTMCPKSIVPVDYMSNTPISPNCQISALPRVFPANIPQPNNNICGNPTQIAEEYTPVPINLQINVPSPTIPEPQITIITAYPPAPPVPVPVPVPDNSDISFGLYPPYSLPPIIIEGRRSKARSLLPLILIALIANDGCCGGGGCCCSPCSYASSDIPIPYPIPIPTNNPIIIGKSRKKASNGTVSD